MENPGLSPAVQAALSRRQGGGQPGQMQQGQGALTQASPQAPMQAPTPQPPTTPQGQAPNAPQAKAPAYQPQNQEDMIVQALIEQLKNSGKMKKDQMKIDQPSMGTLPVAQTTPQQPSMPAQMPPAPQGMPPMGGGGMGEPNFMNTPQQPNSVFEFGSPSMANTSKQNQYAF